MKAWLCVLALAGCGGKQQVAPAPPLPPEQPAAAPAAAPAPPQKPITRREQMMQDMAALTDEMCACKPADRDCALRVQQKLADFGQDNDDMSGVKLSDAEKARAAELGERMAKCSAAALQSEFLTEVMRFKDELCACKDTPCMRRVMDAMKAYSDAHPELARAKMTDAELKIAGELTRQASECTARLSAP